MEKNKLIPIVIVSLLIILGACEEQVFVDRWHVKDSIVFVKEDCGCVDTVTVTIIKHFYHDTVYWVANIRAATHVPDELVQFITKFYQEAHNHGATDVVGGHMIISYVHEDRLPGIGWHSFSTWFLGQYDATDQQVINMSADIDPIYLYTPMMRELARLQLNKKYVLSDDIMNPVFDPYRFTIDSPDQGPYLARLFDQGI